MRCTFHNDVAHPFASFDVAESKAVGGEDASAADGDASLGPLHGESAPMRKLFALIRKVAPTDATVLIAGESGTGKELVASTLHQLSLRADRPFWAVNCGAIAENLIETELFGHERGSFTGALNMRRGLFELADGGTLLLDEVTEMPLEMQARLLRVLETRNFCRVGGERRIQVDVRIIAATNRDPLQAVAEGKLRADLYYRLAVFPIVTPPLRERGDDIALLAQRFVDALNRRYNRRKRLSLQAVDTLKRHRWPGNVRELKNLVERAFILAESELAFSPALPGEGPQPGVSNHNPLTVDMALSEMEKLMIFATLDRHNGDKNKAAEVLGVSVRTLYNRMNAYRSESAAA